jgi:Zn-dependent protease
VIAWGGVLAQAAAFATAGLAVALLGPPATLASAQFHDAFTTTNLWMMLINLIPVEPLDGAKAWPLFGMLYRRFRARSSERRAPRFEPGAQSRDPREEARKLVRDLLEQSTKSKPDA